MKERRLLGIGLLFVLSIVIFVGFLYKTMPNSDTPQAKWGVLDLSGWDFQNQGVVNLDGQWEFYEGQLLTPADFQQGIEAERSYLTVPGTWKGDQLAGGMSRKGFGTYRLKVKVHDPDEIYGVKVRSIRMSHQLYIDGKLVGGSGLPTTTKEANQPANTPYSAFFNNKGQEIEIVLQVANWEYVTGGVVNSIQFGLSGDMALLNGLFLGSDIATICILGMFGLYHLGFYFLRRSEKTYLYSALYLLELFLAQSVYGEKILLRLFPNIPFDFAYKLLEFCTYLGAVFIILFFRSINPHLMSRRTTVWVMMPIALFLGSILVLPYSVYNEALYLVIAYCAITLCCIFGRMVFLYGKNHGRVSDQRELLLFIAVAISLGVFITCGTLYTENVLDSDLPSKLAVSFFIIFMNILMAARFTDEYEKSEDLSRQLVLSNQLKDEFLKHTSHEIKTPLHGIMNMTSHLLADEEHPLSSMQKQNLWMIKDTAMKLSMLIHDLIDVTRLKNGELRLHPTIVDVRVVTQFVFEVLQSELLGKAVLLENQVAVDVWVHADENRFRQILYNIVHNAIKHTDKGTIKVLARVVEGFVQISVEDTGTGIRNEDREAIFEYFERLPASMSQNGYSGMGVGLYISRKLVEQMGGEIRVAWSEVGEGTRMTFTLPSVTTTNAHSAGDRAHALQQPRTASDSLPLDVLDVHEYTILIVDDEASNIHVLLNILKRHRYNVLTAFSAKEAMGKLKEHPQVDLVILDVVMPGVSGIELCRRLRTQHSILDLPILFATAKETSQDIALGFRAGANDFVTKPFDEETLIARVQTLIAMKTSIQEAIRNEMAFHQAQIKPHFLYNALSSVIAFCYTDGEKAAYLLSMLSQYLRYILEMDRTTLFVPLQRELELIHAYVEIEKERFGERLDFVYHVDDSLLNCEVPSLCIQPFVENAIRHGLFEKDGDGQVTLMIVEGDRYMQVIIEDDGVGIPDDLLYQIAQGERMGGIAIANIRKRLDAIPGATLLVSSELGRGTKVTMYLPLPQEGLFGSGEERRGDLV